MIKYGKAFFIIQVILLIGCNPENKKVGVQTFENFTPELRDTVKAAIERYYKFKVYTYPSRDIPANFFVKLKTPRYRADSLIKYLKSIKPDSIDYFIGLTEKDISVTISDDDGNVKAPAYRYKDWGVFGYGYQPGSSCVVSTFRLNKNHKNFISRLKKISLHEVGHNLGLEHCMDENCFMRDAAESIHTIDIVNLRLCENCFSKIE
jgi:archaemetzincin